MISDLLHKTLKGAPQIILSFEFTSVSSTLFIATKVQAQVQVFISTEKRNIIKKTKNFAPLSFLFFLHWKQVWAKFWKLF